MVEKSPPAKLNVVLVTIKKKFSTFCFFSAEIENSLKDLIEGLFLHNPEDRLTVQAALQHQWIFEEVSLQYRLIS